MVLTWFAANYVGAVFVPLNTAYRGDVLAHVVNAAEASVMVAHHSLVERLDGLQLPHLREVVAIGTGACTSQSGLTLLDESVLQGDPATLDESAEINHWDIQSIIYTSGPSGHSQGVLSPSLPPYLSGKSVCRPPPSHWAGFAPTVRIACRGGPVKA